MNAPWLLANLGALFVLMYAAYVFARFVTGYPTRRRDGWERDNLEERQ